MRLAFDQALRILHRSVFGLSTALTSVSSQGISALVAARLSRLFLLQGTKTIETDPRRDDHERNSATFSEVGCLSHTRPPVISCGGGVQRVPQWSQWAFCYARYVYYVKGTFLAWARRSRRRGAYGIFLCTEARQGTTSPSPRMDQRGSRWAERHTSKGIREMLMGNVSNAPIKNGERAPSILEMLWAVPSTYAGQGKMALLADKSSDLTSR